MLSLTRAPENPILSPNPRNNWEHDGAFNGCVVYAKGVYHMVYRALSSPQLHNGVTMQVSTVGYAQSTDGIHFGEHQLLFGPTEDWELYGCEDPRITYINDTFYIFYTALSVFPFSAFGIKLAVAKTTDFKSFEKHPVTPFNAKAMSLFPEAIDGKLAALLTINTDLPPGKIALAVFDREEDIWSPSFWSEWYENVNEHSLHLLRDMRDQVELGAPPVKTERGWLVIYSYIKNYMTNDKIFGIEAVLLATDNPRTILGRTDSSLLTPEKEYELHGIVPNIVFPSGALVQNGRLSVYYGAADTSCAVATCELAPLLDAITHLRHTDTVLPDKQGTCIRYRNNPIISPIVELAWQAAGTFNPAAIYLAGKTHIIYRAQAKDGTSAFGYATSIDGVHIDENLDSPIYVPRESFEKKTQPSGNSGCEDPRVTHIGEKLYMAYTAYDGTNPPRVALTSIRLDDFLNRKWEWETPCLISPPGVDDKNACIVQSSRTKEFLAFHRLGDSIWLDFLQNLDFSNKQYLSGGIIAQPRKDSWDNIKIGIAAPPFETEAGWLLLYHGVSDPDFSYKVGAMLLDHKDPRNIIARLDTPILEPLLPYEKNGQVANVVFPCGAVIRDAMLYIYYGGADTVIGVATISLDELLHELHKKIL